MSLAWPAAVLRDNGFEVTAVDLSVEALPHNAAASAGLVGIAVPMHTALRLGEQAARKVRAVNPAAYICFYGLYAWLNADYLLANAADAVIAGEYEAPLRSLAQALAEKQAVTAIPGVSTSSRRSRPHLARQKLPVPWRENLPPLDAYARYQNNGQMHLAGYVESSRGCLHTCRHCPVVPVYNGRFFVIPVAQVMADIRQQVAFGARHITFGDPDFLNGPGHALKTAQALHTEFPYLTFDFTTKVEHILRHRTLLPELAAMGASFVISAFEAVDDEILSRLQKGHSAADLNTALEILAAAQLPVQPTWVAFTPWTTLEGYIELLNWIRARGLIGNIPAVQLAVRLLVPPGSALLNEPETQDWLGPLNAANFTYQWANQDSRLDTLQQEISALAEAGGDHYAVFAAIERRAYALFGLSIPNFSKPVMATLPPPRLTEDWFC